MIYVFVFLYCIFNNAIYSPDSASYLNATIYRSPGYPIFVRIFSIIFQQYFDFFIVSAQCLLGLFAVHTLVIKTSKVLHLSFVLKLVFVLLLVFPFFPPLWVANNICSEGLSYPLYLFFLAFSLDFLFNNTSKSLLILSVSYILLVLTRGQFIVLTIIFTAIYILKNKHIVLKPTIIKNVIVLLLLPFAVSLLDKTYHKAKDGLFIATPFTYINASASALYVSKASDKMLLKNTDDQLIFDDCHAFISENKWLMSSKERSSFSDYYKHFHDNLGRICNYTLHDRGTAYYVNKNQTIVEARYHIEKSSKRMLPVLIKSNFNNWIKLFYSNLVHGFKSQIILFLLIGTFIISFIKTLKSTNNNTLIIFYLTSLILSNALIVAFASHSIMRYLFYNYSLFFIIAILIYKYIRDVKNN
ncbi:hypothetical protein [Corallibacter sp.]|uniref:hypothetical protein n=1 Tax=Corallibacter sp. TaxID=2038084 RepID=UPI003AB6CA09